MDSTFMKFERNAEEKSDHQIHQHFFEKEIMHKIYTNIIIKKFMESQNMKWTNIYFFKCIYQKDFLKFEIVNLTYLPVLFDWFCGTSF